MYDINVVEKSCNNETRSWRCCVCNIDLVTRACPLSSSITCVPRRISYEIVNRRTLQRVMFAERRENILRILVILAISLSRLSSSLFATGELRDYINRASLRYVILPTQVQYIHKIQICGVFNVGRSCSSRNGRLQCSGKWDRDVWKNRAKNFAPGRNASPGDSPRLIRAFRNSRGRAAREPVCIITRGNRVVYDSFPSLAS